MDLQNAKGYSDGHHFIAMPNDAFPRPRTKARHKTVQPNFFCNKDELPHSNSPPNAVNENLPPTTNVENTPNAPKQETLPATPKDKFEIAYKESLSLPKRERKAHIKEQLKDTFKDKEELNTFVDNNVERMKRNAIKR